VDEDHAYMMRSATCGSRVITTVGVNEKEWERGDIDVFHYDVIQFVVMSQRYSLKLFDRETRKSV